MHYLIFLILMLGKIGAEECKNQPIEFHDPTPEELKVLCAKLATTSCARSIEYDEEMKRLIDGVHLTGEIITIHMTPVKQIESSLIIGQIVSSNKVEHYERDDEEP